MEQKSGNQWKLGSLFGIPLIIDASWLFIVGLVTFVNAIAWQSEFPQWGIGITWTVGFLTAILLFVSVLLHELGHSLVAKSQGITVNSITLFLFGGIASLDAEAKTPGAAFWVAIAGPLVSLSLWLGLGQVASWMPEQSAPQVMFQNLSEINLILVLFNLIPGLPLDGGQVLRAGIWKVTGNRFKGAHWAAKVGQALGWTAVIVGLFVVLLAGSFSGMWMALLGWYGLRNAYRYDRYTDLQEKILALTAQDVMQRSFRVVKAKQSLRDFVDQYLIYSEETPVFFAAADGRYRGRVELDRLSGIERSLWEQHTVEEILTPLPALPTVQERDPLTNVILSLEDQQLHHMVVLSPAGAIAGLIDRADIVQAVLQAMELSLPSEELERIRSEHQYPAFLQIPMIAKNALGTETSLATPESDDPQDKTLVHRERA
ncbi:site-2 protease family protein [Lyngbya confervoides]|uniref:Zinc metalloprotease n=1 Tax=Lyngbya confervoides BDU141951 TaxID=1574623 RepID=A0ABD4T1T8_9CYAN|nr:site-2 protease family protein [Lyngbya confervoides]MCM1982463.1 site-2 protease family protein [Lyngbya confervoides BDU141951]